MCHDPEEGKAWLLLTVTDGISWPSGMATAENSLNIFLTFRVIQAHSDLTKWTDKSKVQTWPQTAVSKQPMGGGAKEFFFFPPLFLGTVSAFQG